jgi:hypothetical protein
MRKILLASVIVLAPFAAFAAGPQGSSVAGDVNISNTQAGSTAGVSSEQGTHAGVGVAGNGGVAVGAVSGNYSDVNTTAKGVAGPAGSSTKTTAQQTNIGGTVAGGVAANKGWHNDGATGSAGGNESSSATGTASAKASDTNIGGFITKETSGHRQP